jgi:hypothetical protein
MSHLLVRDQVVAGLPAGNLKRSYHGVINVLLFLRSYHLRVGEGLGNLRARGVQ